MSLLERLPPDIHLLISDYLAPFDRYAISQASKQCHQRFSTAERLDTHNSWIYFLLHDTWMWHDSGLLDKWHDKVATVLKQVHVLTHEASPIGNDLRAPYFSRKHPPLVTIPTACIAEFCYKRSAEFAGYMRKELDCHYKNLLHQRPAPTQADLNAVHSDRDAWFRLHYKINDYIICVFLMYRGQGTALTECPA